MARADVWQKGTTRCRYIYNWKLDEYNKPIISFYYEKIHARNNFKWINPVHEVLETNINGVLQQLEKY